jgi:hypothetical protein
MTQYQVWCHHCDVTFPAKTRRCVHCGGRTSPNRLQQSMQEPGFALTDDSPPFFVAALDRPLEARPAEGPPLALEDSEADLEEKPGRRSLLRAGMSVVWMILLAGGYLWKNCGTG